jgi:hypothetical protein
MTISHSNSKKISIDSKRNCERGNKNINKTNLNCILKVDHYYTDKPNEKRRVKQ